MIVVSERYKAVARRSGTAKAKVVIVSADVHETELPVHGGEVIADRNTPIRRTFTAKVASKQLVPASAKDLFSTYGTVVKVYRGRLIPIVVVSRDRDTTQSDWQAGVLDATAATPEGDLVIAYV